LSEFTVLNRANKLKLTTKSKEYREDLKKLGINVDEKYEKKMGDIETKKVISNVTESKKIVHNKEIVEQENKKLNGFSDSNYSKMDIDVNKNEKSKDITKENINILPLKDNKMKIENEDDDYDEDTDNNNNDNNKKLLQYRLKNNHYHLRMIL